MLRAYWARELSRSRATIGVWLAGFLSGRQQEKLICARQNKLNMVQRYRLIIVQHNKLIVARQEKLTRGTGHGDTA